MKAPLPNDPKKAINQSSMANAAILNAGFLKANPLQFILRSETSTANKSPISIAPFITVNLFITLTKLNPSSPAMPEITSSACPKVLLRKKIQARQVKK